MCDLPMHLRLVMYSQIVFMCTVIIRQGKIFHKKVSTFSYCRGFYIFLLQVLCQKRKPQIDGSLLNVLHIQGQEISSMVKQVTICHCCKGLLCILGWLLQATRGNHVYLPQVGGQKQKPQIDGTYKVKNLHILGEENRRYFSLHYHYLQFISQQLVTTF